MTTEDPVKTGPVSSSGSGLILRVISSVLLIIIAGTAAWMGGLAAGCVVAVVTALVQSEWVGITEKRLLPGSLFAVPIAVAMIVAGLGEVVVASLMCLTAICVALVTGPRLWRSAGIVYAASLGLSLLILREAPSGFAAIVFVFAVVWATDIGAYFAGRSIGGPKLSPSISPKKTWSGAIGGVLFALAAGSLALMLFGISMSTAFVLIILSLSVFSQLGDLFESWIKRRFGVKDSGRVIPGHGGIMDRVDGLIFASVLALFIGVMNQSMSDPGEGLLTW